MCRRALPAVVLAAALCGQDLEGRTDELFARWHRTDSPGCALAVLRGGEIAYAKGYGMAELEHGVPITPRTVFYAASTSKQFVAACIALLEERGALSFDDEVRTHVPEFPTYPWPVTIRQLVHHTSGVRDYLELMAIAGRSYLDHLPANAVLAMICRQRELNFEPGTRHLYSNSCYFLLGVIVERVSGLSLRAFAERHVLAPLGMRDSRFHDDVAEPIPRRAAGYAPDGRGGFAHLIMRFDLVGSGGLYTTVEDFAKWDANLYDNRLGTGGPALVETLLTRGTLAAGDEIDYAFALVHGSYRGAKTVSHSGALGGYRAVYLRFPEQRFAVVILGNVTDLDPEARALEVADLWLADALAAKVAVPAGGARPRPASPPVARGALDAAAIAAIAGDYDCAEVGVRYRLRAAGGGLRASFADTEVELRPGADPDELALPSGTVRLDRGAGDAVTGFRLSTSRVQNLRFERVR